MEHLLKRTFDITENILQIILFIELIIGLIRNGLMVLVHCIDWVKRKKISFVNQILTTLANFQNLSALVHANTSPDYFIVCRFS